MPTATFDGSWVKNNELRVGASNPWSNKKKAVGKDSLFLNPILIG
jgi:hypothetical protein